MPILSTINQTGLAPVYIERKLCGFPADCPDRPKPIERRNLATRQDGVHVPLAASRRTKELDSIWTPAKVFPYLCPMLPIGPLQQRPHIREPIRRLRVPPAHHPRRVIQYHDAVELHVGERSHDLVHISE